jgi:octaprenyl-diphosphate synthase
MFDAQSVNDYVKNEFVSFLAMVASDVERCEGLLPDLTASASSSSRQITQYILERPGKRLRMALFYFCADLVGFDRDDRDALAAVGEIVHTASLLHDDIIDEASTRRGHASPHTVFGPKKAVLVGDMLLASASRIMCNSGSTRVVDGFSRAIHQMSDGELLQLDHLYDDQMPVETYWQIMEYKTSALLAAICQTPAVLSGLSEEKIQALWNYGLSLGNVFQICDDILDYFASSEFAGKITFSDFASGKMTLPLFLLKEKLSGESGKEWSSIKQEFITPNSDHGAENLRQQLTDQNIRQLSMEHCTKVQEKGLAEFLEYFPEALDTPLAQIGKLFVSRLPTPCAS